MATNPDQIPAMVTIDQSDDGLTIHWNSDSSNFYHYFWLRSACYCDICGDTHTGTRRLHPSDVPLDLKPSSVQLDGQQLQIIWPPDEHSSRYDLGWLQSYAYDGKSHANGQTTAWTPRLWKASLDLTEVSHDYTEMLSERTSYLNFLRCLRDYGIAIVRRGSAETVGIESMTSLIGDIANAAYEKIFEIKPQQNQHTYGNSKQLIPPHTDEAYLHTPTGILNLYCINPANEGGESVLVDGFMVSEKLREQNSEAYRILASCPQTYHRVVLDKGLNYRTRARALTVDENENLVGFRFHPRALAPTDVPGDQARQLHAANFALSELVLADENQLCFKLDAGDAVFFDNHRIMHSRKAFNGSERHLQICNVSREIFHQKVRMTALELGFITESRQYLPAGVSG